MTNQERALQTKALQEHAEVVLVEWAITLARDSARRMYERCSFSNDYYAWDSFLYMLEKCLK